LKTFREEDLDLAGEEGGEVAGEWVGKTVSGEDTENFSD
jgi:hypothetical protein